MSTKTTTNAVKTIILVIVASLIAAGVYFSISRIKSKPPIAPNNNQFVEDLDKLVEKMGKTMDEVNNDGTSTALLESIGTNYAVFSHKLQLYKGEQLIDEDAYNAEVDNVNGSFAQKYANYYLNRFKTSEWSATDIDNIRIMVQDLTSFSKVNSTLSELAEIIDIFDKATQCANSVECRLASTAKAKISTANGYLNNEYIKHNPSLCNQLKSLPRRLAENHYEYIEQLVSSLSPRNYKATHGSVNKDQYDEALTEVERQITNYEKESIGYDKNAPSTQELRRTLNNYRKTIAG